MALVPGDQRALTEIESHLAVSDPALATTFAAFAVSPSRAREAIRETARQPPVPTASQRRRARRLALLIVLVCLFVMCATLAAVVVP